MSSEDHKLLIKTLNKLVKQERWRKIPKWEGVVIEKAITKSGNIKFVLDKGITFYVLKRNKNLFETASKIQNDDRISVALRMQLGKRYCVKLTQKKQDTKLANWF